MIERWNGLRITRLALVLAAALGSQAGKFNGVLHAQNRPTQDRDRDRDERDRGERNSLDESLISLPRGWVIPVRLADEVDSRHGKAGELYTGTVDPSVLIHDHVVIPRGTEAHIRLVEVKKGGHFHGKAMGKGSA